MARLLLSRRSGVKRWPMGTEREQRYARSDGLVSPIRSACLGHERQAGAQVKQPNGAGVDAINHDAPAAGLHCTDRRGQAVGSAASPEPTNGIALVPMHSHAMSAANWRRAASMGLTAPHALRCQRTAKHNAGARQQYTVSATRYKVCTHRCGTGPGRVWTCRNRCGRPRPPVEM